MILQRSSNLFVFILTVGVFSLLNTEMGVIGLLPYVSERFGVPINTAGLLVSVFALTVAVSGLIMPAVFVKINRRTVMLLVLGVFTVCNLAAVYIDNFTVLLATRILAAALHPVYCALAFTMAASSVDPEKAPKAVARVFVGVSAGMVIGVPVSNFIAGTFSFTWAMAFFAAINLSAFLATLFFVPSLPVQTSKVAKHQYGILRKPEVLFAIVVVILMNGSVFGVFSYLADYLHEVTNAPTNMASLILFLYGVANVIGSLMAGNFLTHNAMLTVKSFPLALAAVYCLLLTVGHLLIPMIVITIIWGILGGISANVTQYWISQAAPEAPDLANGLFLTSANIGTTVGAVICGFFIANTGIAYVMYGGLLFIALTMFILLLQIKYMKSAATV